MDVGGKGPLTVLFCRSEAGSGVGTAVEYDAVPADAVSDGFGAVLAGLPGRPIHVVGPRPGKAIDPLLAGRVLVVGDDSDLNAVVLRLLRRELLGSVQVGYAPAAATAVTELYGLPVGPAAVRPALSGTADTIPLVRNDSGGVLVGRAELAPAAGTFYVDERRIPGGRPARIRVTPEAPHGLTVAVARRRAIGFGDRTETYTGRAVEFGIAPGSGTAITYDGIRHPREVNRWVFYRHTEPLRLVRELR